MAVYAAMVDRMDQNIGRVLRKIQELGEEENTTQDPTSGSNQNQDTGSTVDVTV